MTEASAPPSRPRPAPGGGDGGPAGRAGPLALVGRVAGGGLIGAAEVVPGVSGGTVALVVGLYERLIGGADSVVRAVLSLLPGRGGPAQARAHLREVPWGTLLPVGLGMVVALVVGARLLEPLVADEPVYTRAVFLGLVAACVVVPLRMVGWLRGARDLAWLLPAAALAWVLVSLPPADTGEPPLAAVLLAAAVAVCALVLPGVSGSFFLLSVGLYEPTLAAVNDADLLYLGTFLLGAVLGLATVVRGVRWLLATHRRPTLLLMAGLMIGSLRALWPWQDDDRGVLGPTGGTGEVLVVVLLVLVAVAAVAGLVALDAAREQDETARVR